MLFFFDAAFAYVIAESTRTLSLADDAVHAPEDALWLGFSRIPRGLSVCEVTVDLPSNQGSNAQEPGTAAVAHIINNLAEDTRFCNQPYVHNGPKARFYAGVPITTARGINIGALCVLDDRPRDGLDASQVDFLRSMATSVMSHLELVKAKQDNQRSHNMTSALGAFMDGTSEPADWWHRGARHPASHPNAHLRQQIDARSGVHGDPPSKNGPRASRRGETVVRQDPPNDESSSDGLATFGKSLVVNGLPARIAATMARAAGLLQTALTADAVIFLDVISRVGSISGAPGLARNGTETDTSHTSDVADAAHQGNQKSQNALASQAVPSHSAVLGAAFSHTGDANTKDEKSRAQVNFPDQVLRGLLRRYPYGQIWHFNADGDASDDEGYSSEELSSITSTTESAESDIGTGQTPAGKRAAKKLRARVKSGRIIQEIFPGVRSFMIIGIWRPAEERWFGAAVVLSYSPTRIFSYSSELSYMAAFCDVVLAQVASLEAQELGRSKKEFISSISHELRSPLHGILGSSEYLLEQEEDPTKLEMARSVNSCGTTLLDIINDLLEYSGLNQKTAKRKKSPHAQAMDKTSATAPTVMVSTLTEDAVDIAYLSFEHQNTGYHGLTDQVGNGPPVLILNIEAAESSEWLFPMPNAQWKRICLNLVTNALKYTPKGYVSVTLRKDCQSEAAEDHKRYITLIVEDSGIGMSQEFQDRDLFSAFRQEDSLAPGTGLGLNLVANIVKSMDGTVRVQSEAGVGTTVTVSIPFVHCTPTPLPESRPGSPPLSRHFWTVDFVGFDARGADADVQSPEAEANIRFLQSLRHYCSELGLDVQSVGDAHGHRSTFNIVWQPALDFAYPAYSAGSRSHPLSGSRLQTPAIVMCKSRTSAIQLQSSRSAIALPDEMSFLWPPISSAKLSTAISTLIMSSAGTQQEPMFSGHSGTRSNSIQIDPLPEHSRTRAHTSGSLSSDHAQENAGEPQGSADPKPFPEQGRMLAQRPQLTRSGSEPTTTSTSTTALTGNLRASFPIPQRPHHHVAPVATSGLTNISLLLVDDNAINLRILEAFAKKGGHAYRKAYNGQEAVDLYRNAAITGPGESRKGTSTSASDPQGDMTTMRKPEIILMDINMPIMDGFEATRAIRNFEQSAKVPRAAIIAVTGLGDTNAQDEAFACGMDVFLTKPLRMKDLLEVFASLDL
ncbi:Histidine protein kinase 1 [Cercospora beticola]|nr:Histidine protein kinase 1 [Cercospora beticola]PIA89364.1 Histidine protein kinase 1 [Cercospora beticola]